MMKKKIPVCQCFSKCLLSFLSIKIHFYKYCICNTFHNYFLVKIRLNTSGPLWLKITLLYILCSYNDKRLDVKDDNPGEEVGGGYPDLDER